MKARLLTKLLNDTGYTVNNNREYIAVGSPMCHDLISVNKKTLKVKYALDTFKKGREALVKDGDKSKTELLFIWDKLHELIKSGEMKDIIEGKDEVENPLPVFTVEDGKLIETFTDKYSYPNTTINGDIMYENTHFDNKKDAIHEGLSECKYALKWADEKTVELRKQSADNMLRVGKIEAEIIHLSSLLGELKTEKNV